MQIQWGEVHMGQGKGNEDSYIKHQISQAWKAGISEVPRKSAKFSKYNPFIYEIWQLFCRSILMQQKGGWGMGGWSFVLAFSHHPKLLYTLFCLPQGEPIAVQWEQVGMRAQVTDSLFVQKVGEIDPTLRTGVPRSICTCCPEMTMLRVWSQREQETSPKIAFPFPHHANSCWSLQSIFSRQWTAFYSAIKTREAGTETGLTLEPRSLKIISTSRILPNCCRETRRKIKIFILGIFPTFWRLA